MRGIGRVARIVMLGVGMRHTSADQDLGARTEQPPPQVPRFSTEPKLSNASKETSGGLTKQARHSESGVGSEPHYELTTDCGILGANCCKSLALRGRP